MPKGINNASYERLAKVAQEDLAKNHAEPLWDLLQEIIDLQRRIEIDYSVNQTDDKLFAMHTGIENARYAIVNALRELEKV